ncbi:MAG: variable surface family protein [Magnetospirillum sp.]|nr:variable surface family protein [Magnetospirillum sp.]
MAFTLVPANIPGHTHMATFTASTGNVPVNIPGTAGSGNITINPAPTIRVVPGSAGVDPAVNTEYYLTGVSSAANGPCTTTAPDTDPTKRATLKGLDVTVDASTYKPEIPPRAPPSPPSPAAPSRWRPRTPTLPRRSTLLCRSTCRCSTPISA